MKFGIFEITTRYKNNGVFGDGYASWPAGTNIALLETVSSLELAQSECVKLSEKNLGKVYFCMQVYQT